MGPTCQRLRGRGPLNPKSKIEMTHRIAAIASLIAFAICLIAGAFAAENPFTTTVARALIAMCATWVVGLIVGAMAQKMLDENLRPHEEKLKEHENKTDASGR